MLREKRRATNSPVWQLWAAFAAAMVAPLVGVALTFFWYLGHEFNIFGAIFILTISFFSYAALSLTVGLFAMYILIRLSEATWWSMAVLWFAIGTISWWSGSLAAMFLDGSITDFNHMLKYFVSDASIDSMIWPAGPIGIIVGLVSWRIVRSIEHGTPRVDENK